MQGRFLKRPLDVTVASLGSMLAFPILMFRTMRDAIDPDRPLTA
jgi:hypothetical protein